MQLPTFTPLALAHTEASDSDETLFKVLLKKPQDLVLFFVYASDDETWTSRHENFMSYTLKWATEKSFEDKLELDAVLTFANSIHKHYPALKSLIPENITVKLKDGEFQENGLLCSASSDYFRRLLIRECRDKNSNELLLNYLSASEYAPIHSYINKATSYELLIMGQEDLIQILKLVLPWQITGLLELIQKRISKYLTDDNVVEMLIHSSQHSWFFLSQHAAAYLNAKGLGFHLRIPNHERFAFEFYDFHEDALKYYNKFRMLITDIICKGDLPQNSMFAEVLKKAIKLNVLDISETNSFSQYFEAIPESIQEINLSECPWISKETFRQLAGICERVEAINLTNNPHLKYVFWSELLKFKQLKKLNLSYCHQIQNPDLGIIASSTPQLFDLNIQGCSQITENGFYDLAKKQRSLVHLNLSHCSLTDNSLLEIATNCKKLEFLDISNCSSLTEKGLLGLVKSASILKELNILRCVISPLAIEEIKKFRLGLTLVHCKV